MNPFVPSLCLKDPQSGAWHNSTGYSFYSSVTWVVRLSRNLKNRENPLLTNNEDDLYWNTFVRHKKTPKKTSKHCLFSWQKEKERILREEVWWCGAVSDTNVSKIWEIEFLSSLQIVRSASSVEWKGCFFGSLDFLLGLFPHRWFILPSWFYRSKSWLKSFLIGCPLKDN